MELYEALKGPVGEVAARMIAEIVPPAGDVVRKHDLAEATAVLRQEIAGASSALQRQITDVRVEVAAVRGEMHASTNRSIRWILGVTVPLWVGTWGMMAAILVRGS
ncbi:MAG: hypothetical protein WD646_08380 [Actinomycetota bacterium]